MVPDMPRSALARVAVDYCLPLAVIATTVVALATAPEAAEQAGVLRAMLERGKASDPLSAAWS